MAAGGFEGFEKRLELHFSGDDPSTLQLGLRKLDFHCIQQILQAAQCTVVSALGNSFFDAYVLSESSLFVYPTKIIIKTCGTTQLLKSIPLLISQAHSHLNLTLSSCRYTRGSFIFPAAQPFPHTSFHDEVTYLEATLPQTLRFRKASVMPSKSSSHAWHVFAATSSQYSRTCHHPCVVEVCMTDLDPALAGRFFHGGGKSGDAAGREMTLATGIGEIKKNAVVCDFAFEPCGYSMNGMEGGWYSTIHVTPEEGYSYASFECVVSGGDDVDMVHMLRKVAQIFRPGTMSVSTTTNNDEEVWREVAGAVEPTGLKLRSVAMDQFPECGSVVFQTFTRVRRKNGAHR
ncbi:hypothetical protein Fmac_009146 [Flemingia macrophylla]|uniref:S-adenosylmethionine decarboxylase proenzyme n=1 Tax=Flemingia macrophylla TaxID=520843 RepID=A0ABD1MZZ3_9FABA